MVKACRGNLLFVMVLAGIAWAMAAGEMRQGFAQAATGGPAGHSLMAETLFPKIKPIYRTGNLRIIEAYCRDRQVIPLGSDCVRIFSQPYGIVSAVIEVDLAQMRMKVYPGSHDPKQVMTATLEPGEAAALRSLVTAEPFKKTPQENEKIGLDGVAYLIETTVSGVYSWKLHWNPEDMAIKAVVAYLQALAKKGCKK